MNDPLEQLKFPVGRLKVPTKSTEEAVQAWIATIAAFPNELRALTRPFDNARLDRPYRPEGWTIRQVVHHCADSHANAYIRLKMALTEEWPTIKPYNQDAWVTLPDSRLPIALSLDLIEAMHGRWVELMRAMDVQDWDKGYVHPEYGKRVHLWEFACTYAWHCQTHLGHVKLVAAQP
jgi:hypothetical protein